MEVSVHISTAVNLDLNHFCKPSFILFFSPFSICLETASTGGSFVLLVSEFPGSDSRWLVQPVCPDCASPEFRTGWLVAQSLLACAAS